jgi:hypothetical protein
MTDDEKGTTPSQSAAERKALRSRAVRLRRQSPITKRLRRLSVKIGNA